MLSIPIGPKVHWMRLTISPILRLTSIGPDNPRFVDSNRKQCAPCS